jgi:hypothetical protein
MARRAAPAASLSSGFLLASCALLLPRPSSADLTALLFPNVAFAPLSSAMSYTVPSPSLVGGGGLPDPFPDYTSVRFTGTLTPPLSDSALNFSALSDGGVRLWVDDFLVIDAGALHNDSATAAGRVSFQTIPVVANVPLPFRLEYSRWGSGGAAAPPSLTLSWSGASTPPAVVPPSAFSVSPPDDAQAQMAALRDRLAAPTVCPWQTHYRRSAGAHTLAPTGLVLLASLVDPSEGGQVLSDFFVQRGGAGYVSRAGPHSRNGSDYSQFLVWAWGGRDCNVSFETTVDGVGAAAAPPQLQFLATASGADCARLLLLVQPAMFDERFGNATFGPGSPPPSSFSVALPGFPTVAVTPTAGSTPVPLNGSVAPPAGTPYLALPLLNGTVGYCAGAVAGAPSPCPSPATLAASVAAARARALSVSPSAYGPLADVYEGIATAVLWNTVSTPQEGTVAIVSRNPNWGGNNEFVADYVLFEWDSYFIALQAALEPGMLRDIGVATLVQVTLARTPNGGQVPNWKSGSHSSNDRSENQVGAVVARRLLALLDPATSAWVLELLLPPLLTWHAWVWASRTAKGGVLGAVPLMVLGSDPSAPHDNGDGTMQGARYESMDNSPCYDAPPCAFNGTTHQIMQYDVSPTALFLSDTEALIALAEEGGRPDVIPTLQAHLNATRAALNAYLWLDEIGSYSNRLFNGTFNARLSPAVLYPLLSGAASDAQAEAMAELLASPSGFCVNASHSPALAGGGAGGPALGLLTRWYSGGAKRSTGCVSAACAEAVLLYGRASFEGVEASVPAVGAPAGGGATVPLNTYVSASLGNATALSTSPPDATFALVRQEAWCFPAGGMSPPPSPDSFRPWPLTNLTLWALVKDGEGGNGGGGGGDGGGGSADYRTCGTAACEAAAQAAGYAPAGDGTPLCLAFDASTVETLPCTVPVPSIARGDANFFDQNYWRGRAWAPQLLLVYFALQRYDHVPALRAARADLVALAKDVMLQEWDMFGHIAENLSGLTGFSQDSGDADPFYAWGGSFGMPAMLEAGFGGQGEGKKDE